jgi:hypothetical protein
MCATAIAAAVAAAAAAVTETPYTLASIIWTVTKNLL